MLKKIIIISTLLFSVSIFATETTTNINKPPIFTPHKTPIIVTQKNPEFTITLKSNRTTGFSWGVKKIDSKMMTLVCHKYVAPQDKKLVGAPGYEEWTFKAIYPTTYKFAVNQVGHVVMQYARPWTKKEATTTSFVVVLKK